MALTITLSLIFATAQVYRINTASAQVQNVADAAALAAENQVADFVLAARLCDAVLLSLSLTGTALYGVGVVALCVPPVSAFGEKLIATGDEVLAARDNFAKGAAQALNGYQKVLPYLAAVRAAHVAAANNVSQQSAAYVGVGILVPWEGHQIGADWSFRDRGLSEELAPQLDELKERALRSEELAQEVAEAKATAFARDCGDNPQYCMYERADRLADLPANDNPLYVNVDTWSFDVALDRARAYYQARYANEAPLDDSVGEQAKSQLRKRFYGYACAQMDTAYVRETDHSFEANFPVFPRNTEEMRHTSLYTDAVYPVTGEADSAQMMHAWSGCPYAASATSVGSIAMMEAGEFQTCPACGFSASSMGSVAAASTSIPNGFEYHYTAVAQEAQRYQKARAQLDPVSQEAKDLANAIIETIKETFAELSAVRIDPNPPGGIGVLALVVNLGEVHPERGLGEAFVSSGAVLGPRAAISASTLLEEHSDEGKTAINSLLDGVKAQSAPWGAARVALDCWSSALVAYEEGQTSLLNLIESALNGIPLASKSGLGTWASSTLKDAFGRIGLQPAKTQALKPVLINTAHVATKAEDDFSQRYLSVKKQVIAHPVSSTDAFEFVLASLEGYLTEGVGSFDDSIEVASIELFDGEVTVPVTIPLPQAAKDYSIDAIHAAFDSVRQLRSSIAGVSLWE